MAEMLTVLDVVQRSSVFLEGKGVESPRLNAEWLIASSLGIDRMKLYMQFDRPLNENELTDMRSKVARRAKREPLQYILGTAPFHELELKVDARALIPRPETEQLVELAIDSLGENDGAYRILDLGTGTGAIALALAFALPRAEVFALDASKEALELAQENAIGCGLQNRVTFVLSDWFTDLEEPGDFDMIVSNPPYLTDEEMGTAEPEVRDFEPLSALRADRDGLADLETIMEGAFARLKEGGVLWLETGIAHRESLESFGARIGYHDVIGTDDWSGRPRFVKAIR
ncbi:peptide chain release factor N(5)-glutamine methyltransferase [Pelagicoccus mobilis]|uniref:Release factor glutamine methyltransferase n=1 Tax=Pelagicoccus mobilis TaxID=415221 RepID=A0A934VT30_9BACT|nr:peptide chain release factor N(5)-glutamine methyltransferase [Pelagicoccus mobilis]MBK1879278.1 peptide chain release factor N(5)-glutamine methyltransferase [Pelagicoccus mobilis]